MHKTDIRDGYVEFLSPLQKIFPDLSANSLSRFEKLVSIV